MRATRHTHQLISGFTRLLLLGVALWGLGSSLGAAPLKYNWQQHYYGQLEGTPSLLFSREMRLTKLAFADIDGDGDEDIFLGQANGQLAYFENQGTKEKPNFVMLTQEYKAVFESRKNGRKINVWNKIDVGERSAPTLVDIDADGDLDLFIGSADGRIWFFENQGNNLIPSFKLISARYAGITVGRNSVPIFADVNLQRKMDLLVGTVDGKVWLYINTGTRKKAEYEKEPPQKVVEFGLETHASPALIDWDDDGDLDLVVGQKNGTLSFFENQGDRFKPNWKLKEEQFQLIDIGGESAPAFADLSGKGAKDLILGSANPQVYLYENRMQSGKKTLWNRSTNLFNVFKLVVTGSRASIATGDLDGDGDLDLIVGEKTGNLNYFENEAKGKNEPPNWVLKTEELIFMTGMENSAPTLGDLDGDGDLDLLIGERQGQVAFVENVGTPQQAKWVLRDKTYFQIDVGSNSVPRLLDMDGDGDLDLLIGNFSGRVILYLNKGTKKEPVFALESTRFALAKVERNAVPAFFDWNKDKAPDMILGGEEGKLQLLVSPSKNGFASLNWEADDKALSNFNVDSLSHPILDDFNGDGQPDLLIGNDEGDFLLYLNKGVEGEANTKQIIVDNSIDQKSGSLVVEEVEGPIELELVEETPEKLLEEDDSGKVITQFDDGIERKKLDPKYNRLNRPLVRHPKLRKSSPTLGDLDGDGDLDLLVGNQDGRVFYYENQGDDVTWNFKLITEDYLKTDKLENAAPTLFDLDEDGDLDIILGSRSGQLRFFVNQGTTEKPRFVYDPDYFRAIWLGFNSRAAVADLNGDGILDLLVGNLWGKLTYIRNDSARFTIIRRDYHILDVGIGSAPVFADLNNGGERELVVGSDDGKIFFFRNEKNDYSGLWKELSYGEKLSYPRGTAPEVKDLDHDGDQDLITGSEEGAIYLYRNDAQVRENVEQTVTLEE